MKDWKVRTVGGLLFLTAVACGGGGSPTSPSGGGGSGGGSGGDGPVAATITYTSSGVSPTSVTVSAGSRVMFVNNDSRPHQPASDPHPNHGSCPALDEIGFIGAGQSRASGNLTTVRTCGYHDHINEEDARLTGTIRVQ